MSSRQKCNLEAKNSFFEILYVCSRKFYTRRANQSSVGASEQKTKYISNIRKFRLANRKWRSLASFIYLCSEISVPDASLSTKHFCSAIILLLFGVMEQHTKEGYPDSGNYRFRECSKGKTFRKTQRDNKTLNMKNHWLVPFKGRNKSLWYNQNFLWQHGAIYIMDNHRAAFWCWLKQANINTKYNIFHIDNHYDTGGINSNVKISGIEKLTIQEYLAYDGGTNGRLFRHENYLAYFLGDYSFMVNEFLCTKPLGQKLMKPKFNNTTYISRADLSTEIMNLNDKDCKTILNLDLDYFFDEHSGKQLDSDSYIDNVLKAIAKKYQEEKIQCITIALSPDYCDPDSIIKGWEKAEAVCNILSKYLEINFQLP